MANFAGIDSVQAVEIVNMMVSKPVLVINHSPQVLAKGPVYVTLTATALRTENKIAQVKWASGYQNETYFVTGGTDITVARQFVAVANGDYTVYVQDLAGNQSVLNMDITKIITIEPKITTTLTLRTQE